jgi:hypothetical protein
MKACHSTSRCGWRSSNETPAPTTTITNTIIQNNAVNDRQAECKALDAQITQYDAQARQPQTGQMQDWITARKRTARDRQFQIRC